MRRECKGGFLVKRYTPVVPAKNKQRNPGAYAKDRYKHGIKAERMFWQLKGFRGNIPYVSYTLLFNLRRLKNNFKTGLFYLPIY
jgi:hypothetical protein